MAEDDPGLILHLGDYIYEGGPATNGGAPARRAPRSCRWPTTATGTRNTSPTRTCRPRTPPRPWLVVPDDHEVENNYANASPQRTTARR